MIKTPGIEPGSAVPASTLCIACKGLAKKRGEVPYSYHFLNVRFSEPLNTGDLYECSICGLWFKHPYLSENTLSSYYESSPNTFSWGNDQPRGDFNTVNALLQKNFPDGGEVLDVGCYRGKFLTELPKIFSKKGIEPSKQAAEGASQAGIEIIGSTVESLKETARQFQAITLFDVFEHLTDPIGTLDILFSHVRPGGALYIVTGTADHWLFRFAGPLFYYPCMPEHVCFLNDKFAKYLSTRYQAAYSYSTVKRSSPDLRTKMRALAVDAVNSPMLFLRSRKKISQFFFTPRLRAVSSRGLYPLGSSNDHALLVLSKTGL